MLQNGIEHSESPVSQPNHLLQTKLLHNNTNGSHLVESKSPTQTDDLVMSNGKSGSDESKDGEPINSEQKTLSSDTHSVDLKVNAAGNAQLEDVDVNSPKPSEQDENLSSSQKMSSAASDREPEIITLSDSEDEFQEVFLCNICCVSLCRL